MTLKTRPLAALAAVLFFAALAGCATLNKASAPQNTADHSKSDNSTAVICSEPRPRVCTMEYMPVCAQLVGGGEQVFASKCNACADITVAAYIPQPCEAR